MARMIFNPDIVIRVPILDYYYDPPPPCVRTSLMKRGDNLPPANTSHWMLGCMERLSGSSSPGLSSHLPTPPHTSATLLLLFFRNLIRKHSQSLPSDSDPVNQFNSDKSPREYWPVSHWSGSGIFRCSGKVGN